MTIPGQGQLDQGSSDIDNLRVNLWYLNAFYVGLSLKMLQREHLDC